jgi:hypothetical protein
MVHKATCDQVFGCRPFNASGMRADEVRVLVGDILLAVIGPLGILAHELGHGAVALYFTDGPVQILVGRQPGRLRARVGRLHFSLHIEPARGTGWRGLCVFKPTGVPRDQMLILAAGPMASLVWAIVCTAALVVWGKQLHVLGDVALVIGVVEGAIAFVYNGAAAVMPQLMASRPRSDGAKLQRAVRAQRELRAIEARLGRPITRAEIRRMVASKTIPSDMLRERTSIPPPQRQ